MQSLSASSSAEQKCGLSHGTASHYWILCPKAGSSDAGGAHAETLMAPRSDCETNQAAAFVPWHTHSESNISTYRVPCISVRAQSIPAYWVWNVVVVVVVAIIKIIIIFTSFSSLRYKKMSLWDCCKCDILFCKLFRGFGQGRMFLFNIRIIFFISLGKALLEWLFFWCFSPSL